MSQTPIIYNYDKHTGLFISTGQADPDPLQPGQWLIPAHSTQTAPPAAPQGQVAVMSENNGWALLPDHRGTWYNAQGAKVEISDVQADVSQLTRTAPPSPEHELVSGQWQLSAAKVAAKFQAFKTAQFDSIRAQRKVVLDALVGIAFAAKEAGDNTTVTACMTARQALLDLTKHTSITSATTEAALKTAFKTVYGGIVAAAPANVKTAFDDVQT